MKFFALSLALLAAAGSAEGSVKPPPRWSEVLPSLSASQYDNIADALNGQWHAQYKLAQEEAIALYNKTVFKEVQGSVDGKYKVDYFVTPTGDRKDRVFVATFNISPVHFQSPVFWRELEDQLFAVESDVFYIGNIASSGESAFGAQQGIIVHRVVTVKLVDGPSDHPPLAQSVATANILYPTTVLP